jgi:hypothetical protein
MVPELHAYSFAPERSRFERHLGVRPPASGVGHGDRASGERALARAGALGSAMRSEQACEGTLVEDHGGELMRSTHAHASTPSPCQCCVRVAQVVLGARAVLARDHAGARSAVRKPTRRRRRRRRPSRSLLRRRGSRLRRRRRRRRRRSSRTCPRIGAPAASGAESRWCLASRVDDGASSGDDVVRPGSRSISPPRSRDADDVGASWDRDGEERNEWEVWPRVRTAAAARARRLGPFSRTATGHTSC